MRMKNRNNKPSFNHRRIVRRFIKPSIKPVKSIIPNIINTVHTFYIHNNKKGNVSIHFYAPYNYPTDWYQRDFGIIKNRN